jgi:hemoglobin-like flavoprotein
MRCPFALARQGLHRTLAVVHVEGRAATRAALITEEDKALVASTWRLIIPIQETAADLFYRRLFELAPQYRGLFKSDMEAQKRKLMAMLAFVVKSLSWPETAWREDVDQRSDLFLVVLALGRRHSDLYRVPSEAYEIVREALMWTLDYGLGEAFTPAARSAWSRVFELVGLTMRLGQSATEMGSPMELS